MAQPDFPAPPITDEMRERAKDNPGGWLYIVDPGYQASGEDVPQEGVVGAFPIDSDGEIQDDFQYNDQYQPSDLVAPPPEPSNELEAVLNRIIEGQASESELPAAVLSADVLLYSPSEEDEAIYAAELSDGSQLVPACTSAGRIPDDWPGYRTVSGRDLPELLGGLDLGLNLHEGVQVVIPNSVLLQAAES